VDTADRAQPSGVVQPGDGDYASYHYEWTFNDSYDGMSPTWATNGRSKDKAIGYVAAHVFESPGNYVVKLDVKTSSGQTRIYQQEISVQPFSGTTYYVSYSDGSDSNSGLTPSTSFKTFAKAMSMLASDTRVLFKRGDSWSTSAEGYIGVPGPGIIGAYHGSDGSDDRSQPKPRINVSGSAKGIRFSGNGNVPDWRIRDIEFVGSGSGDLNHRAIDAGGNTTDLLLLLRVDVSRFCRGAQIIAGAHDHDGNMIAECHIHDNVLYGVYIGGCRVSLLGNTIERNTGSHLLRSWKMAKGLISHNVLRNPGGGRLSLKLHAFNRLNSAWLPGDDTEYVVVSDNDFQGATAVAALGPESERTEYDERLRHIIFERNIVRSTSETQIATQFCGEDMVIRNNLYLGDGGTPWWTPIRVWTTAANPTSTNIRVFNNTAYRGESASEFRYFLVQASNDVEIRNNLGSVPGTSAKTLLDGTATLSNNLLLDNPLFNPAVGDFTLQSTSPAVDAGATVPTVAEDFAHAPRPQGQAYDVGAYER
jgi:hypothetical protein